MFTQRTALNDSDEAADDLFERQPSDGPEIPQEMVVTRGPMSTQMPLLDNGTSTREEFQRTQILGAFQQNIKYGELDFFTQDHKNTVDKFLNDIMIKIDLRFLYRIVDTCYYSKFMPYCPVLLENTHEAKDQKFHIQVWDSHGNLIYEPPQMFKEKPISWCVTYEFFVYRPHSSDQSQGQDCYYIVNLNKNNETSIINVKGHETLGSIQSPIIGFCNRCLFISDKSQIYVLNTVGLEKNVVSNEFINGIRQVYEINLGPVKNHAFAIKAQKNEEEKSDLQVNRFLKKDSEYLIIACETSDYQIDFATLTFFPGSLSHKLCQISEMIRRKTPILSDSIKKFRMVYDEDQFCFAATLTERRKCDLYWNYNRSKDGHDIPNVLYTDFDINFHAIYAIRDSTDEEANVVTSLESVQFNQQGKICLSESQTIGLDGDETIEEALERLSHEKCSNLSNIYQSFCLISTSFMVAHHKKVFIFDITQSKLVQTIECTLRILKLFPNKMPKPSNQREIGIIFDDGSFSVITQNEKEISSQDWELKHLQNVKTKGVPIKVYFDKDEYSETLFVLSENKTRGSDQKQFHLEVYARRALILATGLFQANSTQLIMIGLQHTLKNSMIILLDKTHDRLIIVEYDQDQRIPFKQLRSIAIQQNQELYKDPPHSAITEDIDKKFIMFGQNNMYIIDQEEQGNDASVAVIQDINIINAKFIDKEFCYSIIKSKDAATGGLKIFRLQNVDQKSGKPMFLDVEPSHEGPKNHIELNIDSQRLIYLRDNYEIHIIPPLHRSTINFFGMLPRVKYLATRRKKDKFYALDVNNKISTWSIGTGKLISVNQAIIEDSLVNVDYSYYKVFGFDSYRGDQTYVREWNHPYSLVYNYKEEEKYFDNSYNKQSYSEIQGCQTFEEQTMPKIKARRFKYIQIVDQKHVQEKIDFVHNHFSGDQTQKLHISNDAEIMIERLENHRVLIYTRNADNKNNAWKFEKTFDDFPHDVFTQTKSSLYLFTPDLKRFACLSTNKDKIVFNKTLESEVDDDSLPCINIRNLMLKSETNSKIDIFKRFTWVDNNRFLLCSSQGFEKLYQIDDNLNTIKDIGSSQIPAFFECNDAIHLYTDNIPLDLRFVKRRLFRKHQQLKRQRYLINPEINKIPIETLIGVDFNVDDNGKLGKYVIDMPFTWILWKITEEIEKGNLELLQQMDDETLQVLCLNIMPQCQTFMHKIKDQHEAFYAILQRIPCCTPTFEMPFIKDIFEKTRLHYCIDDKGKDLKTAGKLINYLCNANLDHHSREIVDVLPKLIREDLQALTNYFQRRSIPNAYLKEINRGEIMKLSKSFPVGMMSACIWHDFELMKESLFVQESQQTLGNITEVELFFIDLPGYQSMASPNFVEFFRALKDTSNIQLFELVPIRALIEFHWADAKYYTLKMLGVPFVAYLLQFIIYTNLVDELNNSEASFISYTLWYVNIAVLFVFSAYFIWTEITQIMLSRYSYFKDLWNYVDFTPPIVVMIIAIINVFEIETKWESVLKSIGSLFMWLKMLYFLRINKQTGYQIRMISKVLVGMNTFLLVLFVTILAVTDAQLSIKKKEDMKGVTGFWPYIVFRITQFFDAAYNTYQMILGNGEDLETQEGFEFSGKLLIIFSTLLLMIVMLNLLIAIIGDIFNKVQENQLNEYYQEKATIIYENQYLIPEEVKLLKPFAQGNLLLLCQRAGYDIQEGEDDQMQKSEDKRNQELLNQFKEYMDSQLGQQFKKDIVKEGQESENMMNPLLQASARRILTESALRQQSFFR